MWTFRHPATVIAMAALVLVPGAVAQEAESARTWHGRAEQIE